MAANAVVVGIVKIMFFPAAYADSLIWRGGGGGDIQKRSFFVERNHKNRITTFQNETQHKLCKNQVVQYFGLERI